MPKEIESNKENEPNSVDSELAQRKLAEAILHQMALSPKKKDKRNYKMYSSQIRYEMNEIKNSFPNSQWVMGIIERRRHFVEFMKNQNNE